MLPFTKAESWPNIGFRVTAGSSGTSLLKAALASSLGLGIFIAPRSIGLIVAPLSTLMLYFRRVWRVAGTYFESCKLRCDLPVPVDRCGRREIHARCLRFRAFVVDSSRSPR